jgi:DUF2950 family protein/uncharacterized protein DUF3300
MNHLLIGTSALVAVVWLGIAGALGTTGDPHMSQHAAAAAKPATSPEAFDKLLAPIALYPDQLLAQTLLCAAGPGEIGALQRSRAIRVKNRNARHLAAIRVCGTYVAAQRLYAERGHDGHAAGLYASTFRSDPGRKNGLYWPARRAQKRSPLGDLVAYAAAQGSPPGENGPQPSPFHGYYFRILTAHGLAAPGGAKDYLAGGGMSGHFAVMAWPAQYDVTGVMTVIVKDNGIVHEQDLRSDTDSAARRMAFYNPDASWTAVR